MKLDAAPEEHSQETNAKKATLAGVVRKAAFIFIPIVVVTIAARNSIVWHLDHYWGAPRLLFTSVWLKVYDLWDGNEQAMAVWGTWISMFACFWIGSAFFTFCDLVAPPFIQQYKIQEAKNFPVDRKKLLKVVLVVLLNQILCAPYLWVMYLAMEWRGCTFKDELPTFHWFLVEFVAYLLVEEVGFYYVHRLLHHPRLYKAIHKLHHEWQAPVSLASIYCHPIEHCLSNVAPIFAGPIVMGSHLSTAWFWMSLATINTLIVHSGYHLPFIFSNESHDFHHSKFNQNFGVLGILDYLHGTDAVFRRNVAYERHFVLCGLTSAKELVPDHEKEKDE